jgi:hypothetical protein
MFTLYIDESGKHDLRNINPLAPHFTLAGIIIHRDNKEPLKIKADRIKFKYWGKTDIVFHAHEMRQEADEFSIFKTGVSKLSLNDFCDDFKTTFLSGDYRIGLVSINKTTFLNNNPTTAHAVSQIPLNAKKTNGWVQQVKGISNGLLKEAATELLTMYLSYLIKKGTSGEVVIESSDEIQDILIYSAYNKMLTYGFAPFGMTTSDVRKHFTGISFVTKKNHDIETQLADISAHYLNLELKKLESIITTYPKTHDEDIISILNTKKFNYKRTTAGLKQSSFYKLY